jgi:hypothetical protein
MERDDWIRRSRRVCDDQLLRDIVNDHRGDVSTYSSPIAKPKGQQSEEPKNRTGWVDPPKVDQWKPPGIEHIDRMMDQADAIDRAERIRQLAETEALRRAEAELKARQLGLSHEEWARLSEKDIVARKEQQKLKEKGPKA